MNTENNDSTRQRILVGVDDSESSLAAVRWAADEAAARAVPLLLLHATPYEDRKAGAGDHSAQSILGRGRTVARRHAPGVDVSTHLVTGTAAEVLVDASADASLLVVGLTGGGRVEEVLLSSITLTVSGRAACPVVGVRTWPRPAPTRREIVLAMDADTEAAVLDTAFALAEQGGCELTAVHCATSDRPGPGTEGQGWVEEQLAAAREAHPTVKAHAEIYTGLAVNTVNTLLRQSEGAEAIVVGSRNRSRAVRMLLGSTSRGLLRHSLVPVVVIGPRVCDQKLAASSGGSRRAQDATPTGSTR